MLQNRLLLSSLFSLLILLSWKTVKKKEVNFKITQDETMNLDGIARANKSWEIFHGYSHKTKQINAHITHTMKIVNICIYYSHSQMQFSPNGGHAMIFLFFAFLFKLVLKEVK